MMKLTAVAFIYLSVCLDKASVQSSTCPQQAYSQEFTVNINDDESLKEVEKFLEDYIKTGQVVSISTVIHPQPEPPTTVQLTTTPSEQKSTSVVSTESSQPGIVSTQTSQPSAITQSTAREPPCNVNLSIDGCFWLVAWKQENVTYAEGERICRQRHSSIATIRNSSDYSRTNSLLRDKMINLGKSYFYAWINGTINTTIDSKQIPEEKGIARNQKVSEYLETINHNTLPFVKWSYVYERPSPREGDDSTHLTLYADRPHPQTEGMINKSPSESTHGVICFYSIENT